VHRWAAALLLSWTASCSLWLEDDPRSWAGEIQWSGIAVRPHRYRVPAVSIYISARRSMRVRHCVCCLTARVLVLAFFQLSSKSRRVWAHPGVLQVFSGANTFISVQVYPVFGDAKHKVFYDGCQSPIIYSNPHWFRFGIWTGATTDSTNPQEGGCVASQIIRSLSL
jgi:hypothetical protein